MKNKEFDCVQWVRDIRNKEYEENKTLSIAEYARKMSAEVQESTLYKDLIVKRGVKVVSASVSKRL